MLHTNKVRAGLAAVVLAGSTVGALALTAPASSGSPSAARAAKCPWMRGHQSPSRRAHELVRKMTLDQKVSELYGRGDFTHYGAANYIPAVPSLCIPQQVFNDAGAGLGDGQEMVTAFPDGITQAASWDRKTERQVGAAIGWEAWHKGIDVQLAPGVDVTRNPLAGRSFEYAGEDPYLSGQTAVAEIDGIQSQHVAATVKHYALNDQETNRTTDSSDASVRTMQEIDLPPFEAAVKQGHVASVMCGYNRVNGVYDCQNRYLLRKVLDRQFHFPGWVMSDWGATHSTVAAAKAGLDQEQAGTKGTYFSTPLKQAVQQHKLSMRTLNDMVFRLMRSLFATGVFDHPPAAEPQASKTDVHTAKDKAIALQAAEGGAVLLKNSNGALPISGHGKRIAVIGDPASPNGAQNFYQGGGSSRVPIDGPNQDVVDPLSAITARAQTDGDTVTYTNGSTSADAAAAKTADEAVVFIADGETEGVDRTSLNANDESCSLSGCSSQNNPAPNSVVAAVAAANPNTVVVVQAGGPVAMPWLQQVRSVLDMWYPGEQDGNVAARLLFGDVDPSGKLPFTFPTSMSQSPIHSKRQWPGVNNKQGVPQSRYSEGLLVGYRWYDAKHLKPMFPFGFGLSYTNYRFSHLRLRSTRSGAVLRFTVTNTGQRSGAEVAQIYVGDPRAAHEPPLQLKGYRKVALGAGQHRQLTMRLNSRSFSYWNTHANNWRVARGCYSVRVGDSSAHLPLRGRLGRGGASCRG